MPKTILKNILKATELNVVRNTLYIPYRSDRCFDDFDWDSLYANKKEVNST